MLAIYGDGNGNAIVVSLKDVNSDWLCLDGVTIMN